MQRVSGPRAKTDILLCRNHLIEKVKSCEDYGKRKKIDEESPAQRAKRTHLRPKVDAVTFENRQKANKERMKLR